MSGLPLAAIAWAAREQGMSYGEYVAQMGQVDTKKVARDYAAAQREKEREAKVRTEERKKVIRRPRPAGRPAKLPVEEAARLYDLGYNDAQIGRTLGFQDITICHWRRRTGRPANAKQGQKSKKEG